MRSIYKNIAHNPRFQLWPFGSSGIVATGPTAARWKLELTNANDVVAVSKGTNASTTKYDKWMRSEANMTIAVTGLDAASTLRIRQFQEWAEDFGQNCVVMTVIASGPAGSSFYFGIGDNYDTLTTLGNDAGGDPIMVAKTSTFAFDDPVYEYMRVTPFESPSAVGTYRLHYVNAEVMANPNERSEFELRPEWEEWDIIKRYITPIKTGMFATGAGVTGIRIPVVAPPGGWRIAPSIAPGGRATSVKINLNSGGTEITNNAPVFTLATTPPPNVHGCVILFTGFTTTAAASQYVIGDNPDPIFYLNADYF